MKTLIKGGIIHFSAGTIMQHHSRGCDFNKNLWLCVLNMLKQNILLSTTWFINYCTFHIKH